MRSAPRVVVTGIGVIAPNGMGKDNFWDALVHGVSGVDSITRFDPTPFPCHVAGEVRDFEPKDFVRGSQVSSMGRFSQFAVAAARLAAEDAGLPRRTEPVGVCLGTSADGHADVTEAARRSFLSSGWKALNPSHGLEVSAHAATSHVQRQLGLTGPLMTVASACCTGTDAIAWGANQIRTNAVKVAVVGACECPLLPLLFGLFTAGDFLATWTGPPHEASRPYDMHRSGLVLSEGAAVLVLEDLEHAVARNARVYAELLGYASSAEAATIRHPHQRYVRALQEAIALALRRSCLEPQDIDYICAHGNSTKFDDAAEAEAHRRAFGSHAYCIPVSSIKSMIGQPLSAGGAIQAAATVLALYHKIVPPTINLTQPDPACDLDYVPCQARVARIRRALCHSHSLGGRTPGSHSAMVVQAI